MKKLLLIALILFTTLAYSQKPKVSAVRYTDVTTTERDNYSVPAGEFWRIYNTTTTQNEYWDGDSWEPLSISEATFNLNSKNYSWGESYIYNWRDLVLDDGATYFPNNGGYEKGRLHQLGLIPSLHFIPAAVGEGVIYAIGKNRVNDLTVDRASFATYVDEDGIIQTALADVARIDYTDGDGAFLIEPQSTNVILRSEEFENGSWVKANATITANQTISPDGTLNADLLSWGAGGFSNINQSFSLGSGTYTYSLFIKENTSPTIALRILGTNISGETSTVYEYNFSNETLSYIIGGVADNTSIKTYINGWIKISITITADTLTQSQIYVQWNVSDNVSSFIWGAKIATENSSYIKTENTSVTRLADVITGAGDVNTFNSISGSFKVNIRALDNDLSVRTISINDGTANNAITIGYNNVSNTILAEYIISGSPVASLSYQVSDITDYYDVEFQYALNDFKLLIDDVERDTDVSGAVLSADTLDSLDYHDGAGSNSFYGKQKQLIIQK